MTKVIRKNFILFSILLAFTCQQFSIPFVVSPIRPYMITVVFAALVIILSVLHGYKLNLYLSNFDLIIVFFYFYMLVTSLYADNLFDSSRLLVGILILLSAFFVIKLLAHPLSTTDLNELILVVSVLFIYISFIMYLIGCVGHYLFNASVVYNSDNNTSFSIYGLFVESDMLPRIRGVCDSPNNFGMYCSILFPYYYFNSRRHSFIFYIIAIISILITFSVTCYLAFVLMLLYILFTLLSFATWVRLFLVSSIMLIAMYTVYLNSFSTEFIEAMIDSFDGRMSRVLTGSGRWELWEFTFDLIKEKPIFGYGLNQARNVLLPFREVQSTHNNILEVLIEGGVFALVVYLIMCLSCISLIFSDKYSYENKRWIFFSTFGMFIFSMANVNIYSDSLILLFALISSHSQHKKCYTY